jgi:hypothetical protein
MSDQTEKKRELLLEAIGSGAVLDGAVGDNLEKINRYLEGLGVDLYVGTVSLAGRHPNGYTIAFETNMTSYGSVWPEWAFTSARDALLRGKKLLVIADGEPYGFNLLAAFTSSQAA